MEVFPVGGMNSLPSEVAKIAALVEEVRPDRVHLSTAVRPPSEEFAVPVSRGRLESLTSLFYSKAEVIAEFEAKQRVEMHAAQEEIYSMLGRRPCTAQDIALTFSLHSNEVSKYLGKLLRDKRIRAQVALCSIVWRTAKRQKHETGGERKCREKKEQAQENRAQDPV